MRSLGVVTSLRKEGEKEGIEVRYFLSSLPVDVSLERHSLSPPLPPPRPDT